MDSARKFIENPTQEKIMGTIDSAEGSPAKETPTQKAQKGLAMLSGFGKGFGSKMGNAMKSV